jgi:DinB superfamily
MKLARTCQRHGTLVHGQWSYTLFTKKWIGVGGKFILTIRIFVLSIEETMEHNLEHTIALLTRTPAALDVLLHDLPDAWTRSNEGEKTWSAFDVIGHLIHGELTDWMPRARMILELGETRAFEPFDRWAQERASAGKSLGQLLDEFARLRAQNLRELRALNLKQDDLARRGRHPELGAVTLSELLATWAAHDLTHLHQISRIMAHQYRQAVGPWSAYLGVMQCTGHSS